MNPDKDNTPDRYPADTELKFFGTITASVTHELNNVISIINQTGGLLEDLLFAAGQNQAIDPERLKSIAEKINFQTERGIEIIKRLNSFSHSTDESFASFDLNELLANLGALMERFVSLKGASLTMELSDDPLEIASSPLKVQQIAFLALKAILAETRKGDSIIISSKGTDSKRQLLIQLKTTRDCVLSELTDLSARAGQIGAKINLVVGQDGPSIEIILPRKTDLDNV